MSSFLRFVGYLPIPIIYCLGALPAISIFERIWFSRVTTLGANIFGWAFSMSPVNIFVDIFLPDLTPKAVLTLTLSLA